MLEANEGLENIFETQLRAENETEYVTLNSAIRSKRLWKIT